MGPEAYLGTGIIVFWMAAMALLAYLMFFHGR